MNDIYRFLIFIGSAYMIFLFAFYLVKRAQAITKLLSLKKDCKAKIIFTRMPFLSYFKLSAKPDVIVEIGSSVYLIRLINGKGGLRFLHFASKEFFVTFSKIRISIGSLLKIGARHKSVSSQTTSKHSVKILPPLEIPEEYAQKSYFDLRKTVPVLIFTPAPNEITYVTESKNAIKSAYEGDFMYGQMVFTPSAFVTYADRARREEEYSQSF